MSRADETASSSLCAPHAQQQQWKGPFPTRSVPEPNIQVSEQSEIDVTLEATPFHFYTQGCQNCPWIPAKRKPASISLATSAPSPAVSPPPSLTTMATSDSSCTNLNSAVELSPSSPLARPRPRYFDPHRYSGASASSSPSSSDSVAPLAPFTSPPPPQRVNVESWASTGSLDSPFLGAGRPLSLPYHVGSRDDQPYVLGFF